MLKNSLFIAVPSYSGQIDYQHIESRDKMISFLEKNNYTYQLSILPHNPYISQARSILAAEFLDTLLDEIIFIDSDIVYTVQDFQKLINHDEGVVSGLYSYRFENSKYPVVKFVNENNKPNEKGLIEVVEVGAGFLKIQRHVLHILEEIAQNNNNVSTYCTRSGRQIAMIFDTGRCNDKNSYWTGEDFNFCRNYRNIGGKVWVDPTIKLGHVGRKVYTLE